MTETIVDKAGVSRFINVLKVFIKQERAKIKRVRNIGDSQRKKADSSLARKYLIQVYSFITTWKAKNDDREQI